MKRFIKNTVKILLALALLGAVVWGFLPKPIPVELAKVERGRMEVTVDEDGKTRVRDRFVVSAPLAGQLQRVQLKAGDPVTDKELATIVPPPPELLDSRAFEEAKKRVELADARINQAVANVKEGEEVLRFARKEQERLRRLPPTSSSDKELDDAAQKVETASRRLVALQAAVDVARYEKELALIAKNAFVASPGEQKSIPIPPPQHLKGRGHVLKVHQESEGPVTPGTKILDVGDLSLLEVEVDLLSSAAVKVKPGTLVHLEHWGGEKPLKANVRVIESSGFTKLSALGVEEQRVNVICDFAPDQKEGLSRLKDGYRVEARFVIWESDNALKVKSGALFRRNGDKEWAVYVNNNGKAEVRVVKVGRNNGLDAEILEGLEEGEVVVVHPSDKVKPGVAIEARPEH